ncbi:movement protein [maize striate mosaic virus]|uniref:Movement protein n=1 Tax=maize striate mosaic virus TaxID=2025388 RepID=A0A286QUZ1_9GEMI|nr:movement protein [Maize striate mosaic virus]AST11803.1 movement protein [Maize striate mosaic virus]AST11807.1 movement protein [Maize striate mosaic virus]AST11811.1 movement protein [Maize striate mosaic virus]AST11815.1 movement protein [Maize striate mosaic virus]AST11819.1 movement protein [Maize striate mosaic virus]
MDFLLQLLPFYRYKSLLSAVAFEMEKGPGPEVFSPPVVEVPFSETPSAGSDQTWRTLVLVFLFVALSIGIVAALYWVCVRDCVLSARAKRARTITEFGFGNTPGDRRAPPPQALAAGGPV